MLVAVHPGRLALAAVEDSALDAQLIDRLSCCDQPLLDLTRILAQRAQRLPERPAFRERARDAFIASLLVRHTARFESRMRGSL